MILSAPDSLFHPVLTRLPRFFLGDSRGILNVLDSSTERERERESDSEVVKLLRKLR